jgi:hypothetical protein
LIISQKESEHMLARSQCARFIALRPDSRAIAAAAANAGYYTMPTPDDPYPFGLGRLGPAGLGPAGLDAFLAAPLAVLVGDADTGAANLNRSPAAQRQGPHRLARGLRFVAAGRRAAARRGAETGWTLGVVPGAGHDGALMVSAAAAALFGPADTLPPPPPPPPTTTTTTTPRPRL